MKRFVHDKYWQLRHLHAHSPSRAVILGTLWLLGWGILLFFTGRFLFLCGRIIYEGLYLPYKFALDPILPWVFALGLVPLVFRLTARLKYGPFLSARPVTPQSAEQLKVATWRRQRRKLEEKWTAFVKELSPEAAAQYERTRRSVQRLSSLYPLRESGPLLRPGEYLLWLYLKLLQARDHLETSAREGNEEELRARLTTLETELERPDLTPAARESKLETAALLRQRLAAARSRRERLQEVASDLDRIEQKIALLYDQAAQHNPMNDAGLRVNLPAEELHLRSLSPSAGDMEEMDRWMTEQLSAH